MVGSFAGTSAAYYAKYRRGYPDAIVDAVTGRLGLGTEDTVIDLGCGTGLLTVPMAHRVRLVVGIDPEADMLAIARRDADPAVARKVVWLLGADDDLPAVAQLLPERSVGALTVGQALHFMDHELVFARTREVLRPSGGIAVIANGTPIWQQDSDWSRSLRWAIDSWFNVTTSATCGTDQATQARYKDAIIAAGFEVDEVVEEYQATLTFEQILGSLYSAFSPGDVPADRRQGFAQHIQRALPAQESFVENIRVHALIGLCR